MRKQLDITEGIFPMPVLMVATYNEDGTVNVMNAAWGTTVSYTHLDVYKRQPLRRAASNSFCWVPLRPRTTGAST